METRLPAKLEVAALLRQVQQAGGFATVLHRGADVEGTILIVTTENGLKTKLYDRMPNAKGDRIWHLAKIQDEADPAEFAQYLSRRSDQDSDVWIIELDIANGERFIGLPFDQA